MAKDISLKIATPYKVFKETNSAKVVVPADKGNMTILPDRAPASLLLKNGLVQLLGPDNRVSEKYFIKGGVADIAEDICTISTEEAINYSDVSISSIKEKLSDENLLAEERLFYNNMLHTITNFK